MANKWLSEAEMNALLPTTYSGQIKQADGTYADVTFERVGSYIRDLGGNNTNMVVTWFNADTPPDQHGRYITRYNASISGITLPSNPLDRIIKVTMPLYTSNVKYLEVPVLGWIDLGAAASLSYAASIEGSFETYNRNGVQSQIYSLPSTDGTKIGTTRINNNEGVSVFRNLFEIDEELGDQPISVDFLEMQYMCCYSEGGVVSFWISQICINEDATFPDTPVPPTQEGEWGPESNRAGGDGGFDDTSDNRGDLTGTTISLSIAQQAQVVNRNLQAGGFHVYRLADGTMDQISRVLFSQSYFGLLTVSRYNPLSAILSYHLLPSVFVPLTYNGSAQTAAVKAGGYNFNTDPDAPVQVPVQSIIDTVSHWHVGSVDLDPYFGAFPDFAPYTAIKLHLPYVGEIMIDTNKVQHGSLAVDYTCDVLNGNVCAYVTCKDRAGHTEQVYTATGNAAYSLPIFSESQSGAAVGKLISSGVMSAVTGNAAGMLGTAAAALDAAAFGVQHSPQVHGSFGGNVGMIGDTVCWIEIIRPQWVEPANFRQLHGIPSGIAGTLESTAASGFVQLQSIETDGITGATEQELEEIVKTLKAGIYIGGVSP